MKLPYPNTEHTTASLTCLCSCNHRMAPEMIPLQASTAIAAPCKIDYKAGSLEFSRCREYHLRGEGSDSDTNQKLYELRRSGYGLVCDLSM